MRDILFKDHTIRQCIAKIYDYIVTFVTSPSLSDDLRDELTEKCGDLKSILMKNKGEIVSNDCPIVVTGALVLFCFVKFVT